MLMIAHCKMLSLRGTEHRWTWKKNRSFKKHIASDIMLQLVCHQDSQVDVGVEEKAV